MSPRPSVANLLGGAEQLCAVFTLLFGAKSTLFGCDSLTFVLSPFFAVVFMPPFAVGVLEKKYFRFDRFETKQNQLNIRWRNLLCDASATTFDVVQSFEQACGPLGYSETIRTPDLSKVQDTKQNQGEWYDNIPLKWNDNSSSAFLITLHHAKVRNLIVAAGVCHIFICVWPSNPLSFSSATKNREISQVSHLYASYTNK